MDYLSRAWKNKNAAEYIYYQQHAHYVAFSDYVRFIDSWAGQAWMKKNKSEIEAFVEERARRFAERWTVR